MSVWKENIYRRRKRSPFCSFNVASYKIYVLLSCFLMSILHHRNFLLLYSYDSWYRRIGFTYQITGMWYRNHLVGRCHSLSGEQGWHENWSAWSSLSVNVQHIFFCCSFQSYVPLDIRVWRGYLVIKCDMISIFAQQNTRSTVSSLCQ